MRRIKIGRIILWIIVLIMICGGVGTITALNMAEKKVQKTEKPVETESEAEIVTEKKEDISVPKPDVSEQLLTVNEYSRPGKKLDSVKYLVIHYLGNPNTTAQENRDYFESLKDLKNVSMSANYVVGLEGEIIHCVPDDEVAYASNGENHESISIEDCHMDETGKFMKDTYISLVKLTAYLSEKYGLDREHIIRHYDVNGKECPLYYVENESYWEEFKDDVMKYREQCEKGSVSEEELEKMLKGTSHTYTDMNEVKARQTEKETEKAEESDDEQYEEEQNQYETESYQNNYEQPYSQPQYEGSTTSDTQAPTTEAQVQETTAPVTEAAETADNQSSGQEAPTDDDTSGEAQAPVDNGASEEAQAPVDSESSGGQDAEAGSGAEDSDEIKPIE